MCGCYVEVVFNVEMVLNFVAKARHHPNVVPVVFFGFDIHPYILFHFFLNVFLLFFYNNSYN